VLVSFAGAEAGAHLGEGADVDPSGARVSPCGRPLGELDGADPGILGEPVEEHLVVRGPVGGPRARARDLLEIVPVDRDGITLGSRVCGGEPPEEILELAQARGVARRDPRPQAAGDREGDEPLRVQDAVGDERLEVGLARPIVGFARERALPDRIEKPIVEEHPAIAAVRESGIGEDGSDP
jgi:hypothetical protein